MHKVQTTSPYSKGLEMGSLINQRKVTSTAQH